MSRRPARRLPNVGPIELVPYDAGDEDDGAPFAPGQAFGEPAPEGADDAETAVTPTGVRSIPSVPVQFLVYDDASIAPVPWTTTAVAVRTYSSYRARPQLLPQWRRNARKL